MRFFLQELSAVCGALQHSGITRGTEVEKRWRNVMRLARDPSIAVDGQPMTVDGQPMTVDVWESGLPTISPSESPQVLA